MPWWQTLVAHAALCAATLVMLRPGFVKDERGALLGARVLGFSALISALTLCSCFLSPAELAWRGVAWASARG